MTFDKKYILVLCFNIILCIIISNTIKKIKLCIFGIAVDLSIISVKIFIRSLEETKYKGTLILFLYNRSIINFSKYSFKLDLIIINKKWPFYEESNKRFFLKYSYLTKCMIPYNKYKYKWNIYRYSIINCWLKIYANKYDFYFLLDVRDTLFQINLELKSYKHVVYLSQDARLPFRIKDDIKWNKKWFNVYISNSSLEYNSPLNSGTIYGSKTQFSPFIKIYVEFIKSRYINTAEQGTLNYLYYSGYFNKIPFIINKNNDGIIYNMAAEVMYNNFFKNKTYEIKNNILHRYPEMNIPYIVHQYDRDKVYLKVLIQKYRRIYI